MNKTIENKWIIQANLNQFDWNSSSEKHYSHKSGE